MKKIPINYRIIRTKKGLTDLISLLYRNTNFVVDLETTSLETHSADIKIVGAGFSIKPYEAFYIPFNDTTSELDTKYILDSISVPLEDETLGKIGQNIKYDYRVFNRFNINIKNIIMDTMIASYCLFNDKFSHALDEMALNHLGHIKIRTGTLLPKGGTMMDSPVNEVAIYCCEDCDFTFRLANYYNFLFSLPEHQHAKKLFEEIELKLIPVLAKMECSGVNIDINVLSMMREETISNISILKTEIDKLAGEQLVLTNPTQIGEVLYNKLKLFDKLDKKPKRTKTKKLATNEKVLNLIKYEPIVGNILQVKKLNKLLSTYLEPIPKAISETTGFVHTSFNQHITNTGRLSSSQPINFQNQPKRSEFGRRIRSAFISRFAGGKILSCDFSQQEMRFMAHFSGEPSLVDAYKNKKDIHRAVASVIYKVSEEAVTSSQRDKTKTINYGLIYGMEADKLSSELNIGLAEAEQFIAEYMSKMTHIAAMLKESKEFLSKYGYIETICGRRRYLPSVFSPVAYKRAAALREGPNMKIQGSSADQVKKAMILVSKYMEDKKSVLIIQVHDELVFDVHPDELYIKDDILNIMINALPLSVPMEADGKLADNWMEAH